MPFIFNPEDRTAFFDHDVVRTIVLKDVTVDPVLMRRFMKSRFELKSGFTVKTMEADANGVVHSELEYGDKVNTSSSDRAQLWMIDTSWDSFSLTRDLRVLLSGRRSPKGKKKTMLVDGVDANLLYSKVLREEAAKAARSAEKTGQDLWRDVERFLDDVVESGERFAKRADRRIEEMEEQFGRLTDRVGDFLFRKR